jgi:uncharacterized protein (UPF0248 family)
MIPIHELLSRIRWDKAFGEGQFEIGYFDRVEGTIHRVSLKEIVFPEDERRVFQVVDESGEAHRVPLHRVREVYRDGVNIWQRPEPGQSASEREGKS